LAKDVDAQMDVKEHIEKGFHVKNLVMEKVRNVTEIYNVLAKGKRNRKTGRTDMNEHSSRSHAIFTVTIESSIGKSIRVGKLNLVDLAGSERVSISGAVGVRLEESKKINKSLSALGNVISALTENNGKKRHIPYRDSKITRLLIDSLGGHCKTTFMAMCTPTPENYGESLSTLKFANRAKNIKNAAKVNEDVNQNAMIRK
jgi:kinesin family protein 3/17